MIIDFTKSYFERHVPVGRSEAVVRGPAPGPYDLEAFFAEVVGHGELIALLNVHNA